MGSTYANVTVLDVDEPAVRAVLAGSGALVLQVGPDVVVYAPLDEVDLLGTGATAAHLSAQLATTTVDALVSDDDLAQVQVFVDGELRATALAPPDAVEEAQELAEMADQDPATLPGADRPPAELATALVGAVGRGDERGVEGALRAEVIFATDAHRALVDALALPPAAVGWGYRYLRTDPGGFAHGTPTPT